MIVIVIVIYIVVAILFGPDWPKSMFLEAGCLGKIIATVWVIALIIALLRCII